MVACRAGAALGAIAATMLIVTAPVRGQSGGVGLLHDNARFMGWTLADKTVRSARISGTITRADHTEVPWVRISRGVVYRERQEVPEAQSAIESGFTGRLFWNSNENGFVVPVTGRARERATSVAYVFSNALGDLGGTVRDGDAGIGIVRATPPNGASMDLFIERASGKLIRAVIAPDDDPLTIAIDRYAALAPGKMSIADYHIGTTRVVAERLAANLAIRDDELAPPAPSATWTFATGTGAPIEKVENAVIFPVTVNGVPGRFLLDTGASHITMSSDFARRVGAKPIGDAEVGTVNGKAKAHWSRVRTIAVDGSVLNNAVVFTDLSLPIVDGIMGFDMAAGAIVQVDFHANRLTLHDPELFAAPGGKWFAVPVDLSGGTPHVSATFANGERGYLTIDSGNTADTLVGYDLHGVVSGRQFLRRVQGAGSAFAGEVRCGYSETIQVEKLRLHDSVVCFDQAPGRHGLLGFAFLSRFQWMLDYPEALILLTPR